MIVSPAQRAALPRTTTPLLHLSRAQRGTLMRGLALALYTLIGLAALLVRARDLDCLSLGDDRAAELGVDVERARLVIFVAASLLVGAVVSMSGMIGFVGLIVPHLVRMLIGADHRLLLPVGLVNHRGGL